MAQTTVRYSLMAVAPLATGRLSLPTVTSQSFSFSTCPTITNTSLTSVTVCSGQHVSLLQVNTTALPPDQIEFVRFDDLQSNPYTNMVGTYVGEVLPVGGTATVTNADFPENTGTTDRVYYVYACLKPVPVDPTCIPFAFITVTIKPSSAATFIAKEATCYGTESKNDGYVSIGGYAPTDTYELSTNGNFTGTKQAIPANGLLMSGISRAGISQTYSVRIYNSVGCYTDQVVTLTNALCICQPSVCVPIAIQKTRSGRVK